MVGHRVIETELLGELTLVGEDETLIGVYFPGHWTRPDRAAFGRPAPGALEGAERELREYLAGERRRFSVGWELRGGGPMRRAVWDEIAAIGYGETRTYAELAAATGTHARAVGGAVGRNPLSIIVPCHRVVGSDGSLTGYAGGLERKRALLGLEGSAVVAGQLPLGAEADARRRSQSRRRTSIATRSG